MCGAPLLLREPLLYSLLITATNIKLVLVVSVDKWGMASVHFNEEELRHLHDEHVVQEQTVSQTFAPDRSASYCFPTTPDAGPRDTAEGEDQREDDDVDSNASARSAQIHRHLKRRYSQATSLQFSMRNRIQRIVNFSPVFGIDKTISDCYRAATVVMVALSTMLFVVTSMPEFYEPSMVVDVDHWWFVLEVVMVAFFTFDFVLRVAIVDNLGDLRCLHLLVDFLSFVGFYVELGLAETSSAAGSGATGLALLRLLRIARILRLFKLGRQDSGLPMLWQVLLKSKDGLFLLVVLVGIAIMVFASVTYYIEIVTCSFDEETKQWIRDDGTVSPFQSIPETFWFIAATVTTVGYGDQTPGNLGGKAWTVLVMLFGVLVLSFPNILIGSNFSEVHRDIRRERARSQLGKYFRKVKVVIRFVRMWREFRIKGRLTFTDSTGSFTDGTHHLGNMLDDQNVMSRRMNFFMFRIADFPDRGLLECSKKVVRGALDQITFHGFSLLIVMQRLIECFSGCATVEELSHSFHFFLPPGVSKAPTIDDVFELTLRGGAAQVLQVFILHREDESAVMVPSKRGIEMLLNFRESGCCPCLRSYIEAREVWFMTTRVQPFDILPLDGYRAWQSVEGRVPKRSPLDFCYDLKNNEAQINDIFRGMQAPTNPRGNQQDTKCTCRYCNHHWGVSAPIRPSKDFCFEPDEEILTMEIEYAKNALQILKLESKLASLREAMKPARKVSKTRPSSVVGAPPLVADMLSGDDSETEAFEGSLTFSFSRAPTSALSKGKATSEFGSPQHAAPPPLYAEGAGPLPSRPKGADSEGGNSGSGGATTSDNQCVAQEHPEVGKATTTTA